MPRMQLSGQRCPRTARGATSASAHALQGWPGMRKRWWQITTPASESEVDELGREAGSLKMAEN